MGNTKSTVGRLAHLGVGFDPALLLRREIVQLMGGYLIKAQNVGEPNASSGYVTCVTNDGVEVYHYCAGNLPDVESIQSLFVDRFGPILRTRFGEQRVQSATRQGMTGFLILLRQPK